MPIYFTLQEALLASQQAQSDFNTKVSGGPKAKSEFVQKKDYELKPVVKGTTAVIEEEPLEPAPVITEPEIDPNIAAREDLERRIREILAEQAEIDKKLGEEGPEFEAPKKEPSLIVPLSMVLIDPIRADAQDVHGALTVQARYARQNDEAWVVKPFARKAKDAKKALPKGGWTVGKIAASSVRHPIATAQNMVRDPYENRDIHFAYAVNEMIKKKLFPNNPEMALLVPDSFIDDLLVKGRERRNEKIPKQVWNAIKDFLPGVSTGFAYDTQQKRALEVLNELINSDPDGLLTDIENKTLEGATKLAKRFSQTLVDGNILVQDQKKIGDSRILLPEEKRDYIVFENETTQKSVETQIKDLIKPFVDSDVNMTLDQKKQLIEDVTQIYLTHTPKEKLDKNGKPKGEAVIDVLALIDDLKKDSDSLEFYRDQDNWSKLTIISYLGESKGDTLGGQEKFLTWNQKLAISSAKAGESVVRGSAGPALGAVTKIGAYSLGFGISYLTGISKAVPRTALGGVLKVVSPFLGPAVAGSVAGLTESQSVHLGKFYRRNSRVDTDLTRTSRGKALGEKTGDIDVVRGDLEKATVETVPAETLTTEINKLILTDPNDFGSETRIPANKEEVLKLLINMAHARARLDLTMQSGTKNLDHKTSNWVRYHAGREQEELTNLTGASCQAYARLLRLQVENPALFDGLPFLPTPDGDLNEALKSMTAVVMAGLKEGMPDNLLTGATPLSDFKSQKFYKQIFDASGIPETETQQVFDFINSLQSTDQIDGHTISDWMKESESFRSRMKVLKKIRDARFRFAAATGFVTSYVMGEITKEAKEHVVAPAVAEINDHFAPNHSPVTNNPAPVNQPPAQTLDAPQLPDYKITIDFASIFKPTPDKHQNSISIYDATSNTSHTVNIPTPQGTELRLDGQDNYDYVRTIDNSVIYHNIFVKSNNGFIPNPNFAPDQAHPNVTIDLGEHIDFKTEQQIGIKPGEPENFLNKAENYRIVWGHTQQGNKQPDTDLIFETKGEGYEQHPFGVEITFKDDSVRNSNNGEITTFNSHYEDGTMVALLEIRGIGEILLKDCFVRSDNPDGSHSFSLRLDPTDTTNHATLADGTTMTMAELAQIVINEKALPKYQAGPINSDLKVSTMEIFKLANLDGIDGNHSRGFILFGFKTDGDPKGYTPIPGNEEIVMVQHLVTSTTPFDANATITTPAEPTFTETTTMVTPTEPIEVEVPTRTANAGPLNPTPVANSNFTPVVGLFDSPQLHPTIGEENIPISSTPLRQSIINTNEFKKESQPDGYDNQGAFNFLNTGAIKTEEQIDGFIFDKVFNQRQEEFLKLPKTLEFINDTLFTVLNSRMNLNSKVNGFNADQLTIADKDELKQIITDIGPKHGFTPQEALNIYAYLSHRSYLRSMNSAVQEKKELDRQLQEAEENLTSLPNARPIPGRSTPPRPKPTDPPTTSEHKTMQDIVSELLGNNPQILSDPSPDAQAEALRKINQEAQGAVIKEFLNDAQRGTLSKLPADTMEKVIQKLNDAELFRKIQSWKSLEPQEKMKLKKTISQELTRPEEAETFYLFLTNFNILTSELKKKIESEQKPEKELFEIFLKTNKIHYKDEQIKFIGSDNFIEFMNKVDEKIYEEGLSIYSYQRLTSEEIRKLRETILEIANGQISKDNAEITINYLLFQNDSIVREINREIEGLTRLMIQDDSSLLSDHTTDAAKIVEQKRFEQFIQNITDSEQIKIIEGLPKNIMQDVLNEARGVNGIVTAHDDKVFDKIYKLELLDSQEKEKLKKLINQVLNGEEAEALYTFLVNSNHVASQVKKKIEERRESAESNIDIHEGNKTKITGEELFKLSTQALAKYNRIINSPEKGTEKEEVARKKSYYFDGKIREFQEKYLPEILGVSESNISDFEPMEDGPYQEFFALIDLLEMRQKSIIDYGLIPREELMRKNSEALDQHVKKLLDQFNQKIQELSFIPKIVDVKTLVTMHDRMIKEKTILVDQDGIKDEDNAIRIEDEDELKISGRKLFEQYAKAIKDCESASQVYNNYLTSPSYLEFDERSLELSGKITEAEDIREKKKREIGGIEHERLPIILGTTLDHINNVKIDGMTSIEVHNALLDLEKTIMEYYLIDEKMITGDQNRAKENLLRDFNEFKKLIKLAYPDYKSEVKDLDGLIAEHNKMLTNKFNS